MQPPYPSLTPTWHNDVYPAIAYTNPKVSHNGEVVIVTGAGSGIGSESAVAFATAGAKQLVLVGRDEFKLNNTASKLAGIGDAKVSIVVADVTDEAAVKKVADSVENWNVLVHAAGYMNSPTHVRTADLDDYWKAYEINVKSIVILAKHLLPKASPNASVLSMVGGSIVFPTSMLAGLSGYLVSKLALAKTIEFLATENTNVFFAAVHPGMVETDLFRKSGATTDTLAMDTVNLSAGFLLWLTLPEAKFLNGRFVWANWDIDELKGMQEDITSGTKLTFGYNGFPFPNV
ncbi:short chain dehydrogenase [Nemania sp. FL0031]|nr:short chain dehydrogenase [Nemania sp. FL0031]